MRRVMKYLWGSFLILQLLVLTAACTDSISQIDKGIVGEGDEYLVDFELTIPQLSIAMSRQLTQADETFLETIDLLVFDELGNYLYRTHGANIVNKPAVSSETEHAVVKRFTTQLKRDANHSSYQILVLANVRKEVDLASKYFSTNSSREEISSLLKFDSGLVWNTQSTLQKEFRPLPMCGETSISNSEIYLGKTVGGIKLLRSVARINIAVGRVATLDASSEEIPFKITDVHIYNANRESLVSPYASSFSTTTGKIEAPSLIEGSDNRMKEALKYHWEEPLKMIERSIYLGEAANKGETVSPADKLCLVVGGEYQGSPNNWYRIDLLTTNKFTGEVNTLDVLRNYSYEINISSVDGPGYATPEEAFKLPPLHLSTDVLPWDISDLGDVIFDDSYFLGLSPTAIECQANGILKDYISLKTNILETQASFTKSTSIDKITGEEKDLDWIVLDEENEQDEKDVLLGENQIKTRVISRRYQIRKNGTNQKRTAYIHVRLGRFTKVISITQTADFGRYVKFQQENEQGIWEDITSLRFVQAGSRGVVGEQTYRVVWSPKEANLNLKYLAGESPIIWDTTTADDPEVLVPTISDETNEASCIFRVKPKSTAYTPGSFESFSAKLFASIKSSDDSTNQMAASGFLKFYHIVEDIAILTPNIMLLDGSEYRVTVRTNVPCQVWVTKNRSELDLDNPQRVVEVVDNQDIGVHVPQKEIVNIEQVYGAYTDRTIDVKVINDLGKKVPDVFLGYLGLAAKSIEKPEKVNAEKEVICASGIPQDGREANCYVLNSTTGIGLLIPVRAANGIMEDNTTNPSVTSQTGPLYIPKAARFLFNNKVIGADTPYQAKLVWTDTPSDSSPKKGLDDSALLSIVAPAGTGENGYILVMPGGVNKEGNAVVAVTNPLTGRILWSWHIWVTNEMKFDGPAENLMLGKLKPGVGIDGITYWLDRNLGATSNKEEDVKSYGCMYQWGRKDPTPNNASLSQSLEYVLYDDTGFRPEIQYGEDGGTLREAIENPLTLFFDDSGNWLSHPIDKNDLWNGDLTENSRLKKMRKSIFDPCPAGYRVPISSEYFGEHARYWTDKKYFENRSNGLFMEGGFYPFAGDRSYMGYIEDGFINELGYYLTASIMDDYVCTYIDLGYDWKNINSHGRKSDAASVRCVAEY